MPLHRESAVFGDKALPFQGLHPLEEIIKAMGREAAQQDLHPLPAAQVDIHPGDILRASQGLHSSVLRGDLLQAQAFQLRGGHAFHVGPGRGYGCCHLQGKADHAPGHI